MSFANEASKLLTNKYFLYFIVFLAVSNVLGYLVTNKINAVIFFALICLLMANFSKNMIVVLIVAIIATNLLMVNGKMREGFTEGEQNAEGTTELTDEQKQNIKTEVQQDVQAIKAKRASAAAAPVPSATTDTTTTNASTTDASTAPATTATAATTTSTTAPTTSTTAPTTRPNAAALKAKVQGTNASTAEDVEEGFAPAGVGQSGNKRGALGGPAKPSRIDYATTLEDAYDNLDKILGSGGMKNLSADTEKLINQQKSLFESMNSMMPLVGQAQDMLKGFDMDKIGKLANMSSSFGGAKA